jgi:hypothetical protein
MIDSVAENFKMRFNGFRSHATNVLISEIPFSVEVSDAPKKKQLEFIELQRDSILLSSFDKDTLSTFYASLPVYRFSEMR